jgi:3-oxoacyl-[acyl-carrier-protein] synthase-1
MLPQLAAAAAAGLPGRAGRGRFDRIAQIHSPGPTVTFLAIDHYTATSCIGQGRAQTLAALRAGRGGLAPCAFESVDLATAVGEVAGVDSVRLPQALAAFDCRNNRLALLGLEQDGLLDALRAAARRHGAQRVAVILGTSTSGILETEQAYRARDAATGALPAGFNYRGSHNVFSVAEFVRRASGLAGPACVVSSACSSSAKVFATAARMIGAGLIDAALVGGVDSLCLTTLYGFNSLELLSPEPCRPFDAERRGISIGEAAAYALVERVEGPPEAGRSRLAGYGESSDAHHMSSPHPEGLGARMAMQAALARAALEPGRIDYINLHGTATPSNDAAEGRAVEALFGSATPASSTKGATGHTLGAAGALEAVISLLALQHGLLPGSAGTRRLDPAIHLDYLCAGRAAAPRNVLSNSFGFGGTNASLVFSREAA